MAASTIFRGISFPFRPGTSSFPEGSADDALIAESLRQLVLTIRGERIMRPTLGANVYSLVFENNNAVLADMLRAEINSVVGRFETRVILTDVRVERSEAEVLVHIDYIVNATRTAGSTTVGLPSPTSI